MFSFDRRRMYISARFMNSKYKFWVFICMYVFLFMCVCMHAHDDIYVCAYEVYGSVPMCMLYVRMYVRADSTEITRLGE